MEDNTDLEPVSYVTNGPVAPPHPSVGDLHYFTNTSLYYFDGSSWVASEGIEKLFTEKPKMIEKDSELKAQEKLEAFQKVLENPEPPQRLGILEVNLEALKDVNLSGASMIHMMSTTGISFVDITKGKGILSLVESRELDDAYWTALEALDSSEQNNAP